jgi:hypothetical protein
VNVLFGFEPKNKPAETNQHLLYNKSELILIAKTGFGRSIIFQAFTLIQEESKHASLMIMPLAFGSVAGGAGGEVEDDCTFVLNGDTNTGQNHHAIGAVICVYTQQA